MRWPRRGVTDAASFTPFYWNQQLATAGILLVLTSGAGLGGALLYGLARPRGAESAASAGKNASPAWGALRRSGAISATYEPGSCSADANRGSHPRMSTRIPPDTAGRTRRQRVRRSPNTSTARIWHEAGPRAVIRPG